MNNPYAQFQDEYSLEDILDAPMIYDPLTKLQCCPTSDGSARAIVASEDFVEKHGLLGAGGRDRRQAMTTDLPSTFDEKSCIKMVGYDMSQAGRAQGLRAGGPRPGGRRRSSSCTTASPRTS